jgi:4-aminobutyrate aminotransferase-like enzyme/Ser/Thr protein kinase RdoA (MazF antagonist)
MTAASIPDDDPITLMSTAAPALTDDEATRAVADGWAIAGSAERLDSERDQNFRVRAADGRQFVLKISNPGELPDVLDFQARALEHVSRVAPALPVPRIEPGRGGNLLQRIAHDDSHYLARLVHFLPGTPVADVEVTDELRSDMARVLAELGRALQGFFHPAARHPLLWDMQRAAFVEPLCRHIGDGRRRALAQTVFARFLGARSQLMESLRSQVIHNDFNPDNVLADGDHARRVVGIIDFGDLVQAPLIADLAVLLAYQVVGHDDPLAVAAPMVSAYHRVRPLEAAEVDILFDLICLRLAMSVTICAWRATEHPENVDYILGNHEGNFEALGRLHRIGSEEARGVFRSACGLPGWAGSGHRDESDDALRARRRRLLGPSLRLSYDEPLHIVRGEGARLYDAAGREYLDAYNNVACVGHSHPHVARAIALQSATLNTNTRYLHENIVDYAERLGARLPADLSVCYFVCSGSEANDLAWQIAKSVTGADGAIVTDFAYHGNTTAVAQLSPEELADAHREDWVATVPAPDRYRCPFPGPDAGERYAEAIDDAIAALRSQGHEPAAFFADTIYTSDGIHVAPPGYLASAWQRVRDAGGLCVADEVQAGFGRTGAFEWGFEQQEVVPDIVTLGKPMGNGHPLAAVVTTPEIAEAFARDRYYFNTFGGNPVSCAAGLAVLDVLDRERLRDNARDVGHHLRSELASLAGRHPVIGDVRGAGLFIGVELVSDPRSREPDAQSANAVVNAMRREGVLIGRTGRNGNVLKIRPPLIFSRADADRLASTLDRVLAHCCTDPASQA